jgi:hypothetical protein
MELIRGLEIDCGQEILCSVERRGARTAPRLTHLGKGSAQLLTKARILLKADVSEAGEGWSDSSISVALDTSINNIGRLRRRLVEEGLDATLKRKDNPNSARPRDPSVFGQLPAVLSFGSANQPLKKKTDLSRRGSVRRTIRPTRAFNGETLRTTAARRPTNPKPQFVPPPRFTCGEYPMIIQSMTVVPVPPHRSGTRSDADSLLRTVQARENPRL